VLFAHHVVHDALDALLRRVEEPAHRAGRIDHENHFESGWTRTSRKPTNDRIYVRSQPKVCDADADGEGQDGGQDSDGQGIHLENLLDRDKVLY
jgi:hypothetical protein